MFWYSSHDIIILGAEKKNLKNIHIEQYDNLPTNSVERRTTRVIMISIHFSNHHRPFCFPSTVKWKYFSNYLRRIRIYVYAYIVSMIILSIIPYKTLSFKIIIFSKINRHAKYLYTSRVAPERWETYLKPKPKFVYVLYGFAITFPKFDFLFRTPAALRCSDMLPIPEFPLYRLESNTQTLFFILFTNLQSHSENLFAPSPKPTFRFGLQT